MFGFLLFAKDEFGFAVCNFYGEVTSSYVMNKNKGGVFVLPDLCYDCTNSADYFLSSVLL